MGLLPLPEKLQFEVIPYVSPVLSYSTKPTNLPPTYPNQSICFLSLSLFQLITNNLFLSLLSQQLPFWALISFGAYLLGKLGYGVLTFNDVPQAHEELMAQIQEARKDLKSKGVDVD